MEFQVAATANGERPVLLHRLALDLEEVLKELHARRDAQISLAQSYMRANVQPAIRWEVVGLRIVPGEDVQHPIASFHG